MTGVARAHCERRMCEGLNQLGRTRLMGIMALNAVGSAERLPLVRLEQVRVFRVMAVDAECRNGFGQVIVEFLFATLAHLVRHVTGVAAHVERRVPAATGWHVQSLGVARQAK